ncbi:hypothetical protein CBL_09761 [Carabus blaptoides fortunei]
MWSQVFILHLILLLSQAQFDFEPPCSCDGAYCECCINAFVIDQEGCLRLTLNGNRVRISFVLNGNDLGGFSIQTSGPIRSPGLTVRIPCLPGASLSVRARTLIRTLFDNNFCFDINGNSLQTVVNG